MSSGNTINWFWKYYRRFEKADFTEFIEFSFSTVFEKKKEFNLQEKGFNYFITTLN